MAAWEDLYGERTLDAIRTDVRHPFDAGANGCALGFADGPTVFVFEDPDDGYRSSAADPLITAQPLYTFYDHIEYLRIPVLVRALVSTQYSNGAEGIEMIDRRNGKTILRLGTDNSDDYYPWFLCEWTPANIADNAGASQ